MDVVHLLSHKQKIQQTLNCLGHHGNAVVLSQREFCKLLQAVGRHKRKNGGAGSNLFCRLIKKNKIPNWNYLIVKLIKKGKKNLKNYWTYFVSVPQLTLFRFTHVGWEGYNVCNRLPICMYAVTQVQCVSLNNSCISCPSGSCAPTLEMLTMEFVLSWSNLVLGL